MIVTLKTKKFQHRNNTDKRIVMQLQQENQCKFTLLTTQYYNNGKGVIVHRVGETPMGYLPEVAFKKFNLVAKKYVEKKGFEEEL